ARRSADVALSDGAPTRRAGLCRAARRHDRGHRDRAPDDISATARHSWHRRQEARTLWRRTAGAGENAGGLSAACGRKRMLPVQTGGTRYFESFADNTCLVPAALGLLNRLAK